MTQLQQRSKVQWLLVAWMNKVKRIKRFQYWDSFGQRTAGIERLGWYFRMEWK